MHGKLKPLLTARRIRFILSKMNEAKSVSRRREDGRLIYYIFSYLLWKNVENDIYEDYTVWVDAKALFKSVMVEYVFKVNGMLAKALPAVKLIQKGFVPKRQQSQELFGLKAEIHHQLHRMSGCKAVAVMHMQSVEIEGEQKRKQYYFSILKHLEDSEVSVATRKERHDLGILLSRKRQSVIALSNKPIYDFCKYINATKGA